MPRREWISSRWDRGTARETIAAKSLHCSDSSHCSHSDTCQYCADNNTSPDTFSSASVTRTKPIKLTDNCCHTPYTENTLVHKPHPRLLNCVTHVILGNFKKKDVFSLWVYLSLTLINENVFSQELFSVRDTIRQFEKQCLCLWCTLSSLFCQLSSLFTIRSMQWESVANIPAVVALNVMASPLKSIPLMPLWLRHWKTDEERKEIHCERCYSSCYAVPK